MAGSFTTTVARVPMPRRRSSNTHWWACIWVPTGCQQLLQFSYVLAMQVGREKMFSFISDMIEKVPTSIGADGADGHLVVPDELLHQTGKRLRLCYELIEPSPMTPEEILMKLICDRDDIACLDDLTSFTNLSSLQRSESPSPPPPYPFSS